MRLDKIVVRSEHDGKDKKIRAKIGTHINQHASMPIMTMRTVMFSRHNVENVYHLTLAYVRANIC